MSSAAAAARRSYFICGVQRSGSNLLCEALSRTGVAGHPTEWFTAEFPDAAALGHELAGCERSAWAKARGIADFEGFLAAVVSQGSTPNGVFGAKLQWNSLGALVARLGTLVSSRGRPREEPFHAVFGEPRFIHLRRRDRVRQAVSWALADQIGHYSSAEATRRPARSEPAFDAVQIDGLLRLIREGGEGWTAFFERGGVEPLSLEYEELAQDLGAALRRVLAWLGVPAPRALDLSNLEHRPQAGPINVEWAERYRALRPDV